MSKEKNVIENIKGVSEIIPQKEWSYIPNLKVLKPNYIIHGDDWKTNYLQKMRGEVFELMREIGGEVIEISYTKGIDPYKLQENSKAIGTTPDIRLKSLRRLIDSKPIVRLLEAHSALTGSIIEKLEIEKENGIHRFDGIWSSSLCDSTEKGKPDIEVVDITSRMQILKEILEVTTKPIIYDGDTGGISEHFVFMVKKLEMNGISAVIIEDKTGLKKNSLLGTSVTQKLLSQEEFCHKISEGKKAQVTPDFMIIARIEEIIAGKSVDEAIKKALACIMAGADGIMIHSKEKSGKDIKEFCRKFRKEYPKIPIVLVPTTYNQYTEKELNEWGANIIIYANHMLRAEYPTMKNCMETIFMNERGLEAEELYMK